MSARPPHHPDPAEGFLRLDPPLCSDLGFHLQTLAAADDPLLQT